jgi:hypothetical protein
LIYKTAAGLGGTGVLPLGIIRGDGAGPPRAMNGTANWNAYWVTASTIAAEQYTDLSRGGIGADLSVLTPKELIYKTAAGLGGTGVLPLGILRGDGAGPPRAMNGTANWNTYWVTASTIAAEQYRPISGGGTDANNSAGAPGGLLYMSGSSITLTSALTGVLKGNTAGAPTAMTGTLNWNTYWSNANTIAAEQYTSMLRGGTNANNSAGAQGGLLYMSGSSITATSALTGVLKGNGAGAPSAATQADLGPGGGFEQYNQDNVSIAGGRIGTATVLRLYNRAISDLRGMTPAAKGRMYFCADCGGGVGKIAVSTGTTQDFQFADVQGGQLP